MAARDPHLVILAGPNGSGKTTAAPELLHGTLAVDTFVNPDVIAQGLSGFDPESVAVAAGRIMLERMQELVRARASFAIETTLAARSYAQWIRELQAVGYEVHLVFLWLSSPALALRRVAERVHMGGHGVPEDTIRQRYRAGIQNFFGLYRPLVTRWNVYDSSADPPPLWIAGGGRGVRLAVADRRTWRKIRESAK